MALRRGDRILVDTNVTLESHRIDCWQAVVGEFQLLTVEKVIEETQTGHQRRSPEVQIDESTLRQTFQQIALVSRKQIAVFNLEHPDHGLDDGERDLVIYAASLSDEPYWLLNSPDKGTIRFCNEVNWLDRLGSLEAMAATLSLPHVSKLRGNYTASWLRQQINQFRFGLY